MHVEKHIQHVAMATLWSPVNKTNVEGPRLKASNDERRGGVAYLLEALTCDPEVPGTSLLSDHQMDLFT